ncbi:MAG: choice-of-anchor X domain-containing protein [Planctomycetota bacterium]
MTIGLTALAMANVSVGLFQDGSLFQRTTTDASGTYAFRDIPPGEYTVKAWVAYIEPASGNPVMVTNYPDRDPDRPPLHVGGERPHSIPLITFPDPVILQAGLNGGLSTWEALEPYLELDPAAGEKGDGIPAFLCFPMPSNDDDGWGQEGYQNGSWLLGIQVEDHDQNALKLSQWIENHVKTSDMLGQWISPEDLENVRFSFVCHSMGGLIVRSLVTGSLTPPVHRIVSMDGVHGGTKIAWPASPGLSEMLLNGLALPDHCPPIIWVEGWNSSHTDFKHTWLLYACVPDWVVSPDRSAYGYGRQITDGELGWEPLDCGILYMSGLPKEVDDSHLAIHHNPERLRETAIFLAAGKYPEGESESTPAPHGPPEGLGYVAGEVQAPAGGTASQSVFFDLNTLVYGEVMLEGPSAQYELLGPDGSPLPLTITDSQAEGDFLLELFEIASPPIGDVTVNVHAGPSSAASLSFTLRFDNGRKLVAQANPPLVAAGSSVQLTAAIVDALGTVLVGASPSFSAEIRLPDRTTQVLPLFDDGLHGDGAAGDGTFGNAFSDTLQEGRYDAQCSGLVDLGAEWVERTETVAFAVIPAGGTLTGLPVESTPDLDQNGFYDSLNFDQTVTFTRDGAFRLTAPLLDSAGELVAQVSHDYVNTQGAGAATVTLVVSARDIVVHGVDGPWTLSGLTLYDLDRGSLPSSVASDYVTQAYPIGSFEPPPPPRISWVIPSEGPFSGGNEVVVSGSDLDVASRVFVGENEASFTITGADSLLVTVPPFDPQTRMTGHRPEAMSERVAVPVKVVTPWTTVVAPAAYTYARPAR